LDPGDVGDRAARRRRQVAADVARVARQLPLEPADLPPQLAPHLDRLAVLARVGEERGRRRLLPPNLARDARAGPRPPRKGARARPAGARRSASAAIDSSSGAASTPSATKVPCPCRLTTRPSRSRPS